MTGLQDRFTQPENWQWGKITPRDQQFLRYGWVAPATPKALVYVFPGLSEHIEKYFETIRDLLSRNFAVTIIEWRGHGLSWRYPGAPGFRHHDTFDNDVTDAMLWIDAISAMPGLKSLPKIMLAHSMGAHIALRVLHDRPDTFQCAALNTPLQGINVRFDGTPLLWLLANLLKTITPTRATGPAWSETGYRDSQKILTSDPDRIAAKIYWMHENEKLRNGPVTLGWVAAAVNSMRLTNRRRYLNAIKTPILITQASDDHIVSNAAIEKAASLLPHAELLKIEGSLHEVLMERDMYRNLFWHAFDGFVAKHLRAE